MCLNDVVDICVPRRDCKDRLIGSPINKLEFEKDTYNYRRRKHSTKNEKKKTNFMLKVPLIWALQKVLQRQLGTLEIMHRASAEWWNAQL